MPASLPRASASFPTERPNQPELRRGSRQVRAARIGAVIGPGSRNNRLFPTTAVSAVAPIADGLRSLDGPARLGDPGEPIAVGRARTSSAACQTGAIEADNNFLYFCTAPNVWRRSAWVNF